MSIEVRAYNNGDHSCIVWKPSARINNCLGFAIFRRLNGKDTVLENHVGFQSAASGTTKPSTEWPFQRFLWWDYMLNENDKVSYRVVSMLGNPNQLTQAPDSQCSDWTESERVTGQISPKISCFFNRGIVASQWVARALAQVPGNASQRTKLADMIGSVGNTLRDQLSGHLREKMLELLHDPPGPIFAALYELNDPELVDGLRKLGKKANLILANGAFSKKKPDENAAIRRSLKPVITVCDRLVSSGHFAHNKFVVFCDEDGTPQRVWTGSTNWTETGLCTQANNGLLIESAALAAAFKNEWDRLQRAGNGYPPVLAQANSQPQSFPVDGATISLWFAPTVDHVDLHQARSLINGARQGILFLMFNPGGFQEDPEQWTLLQSIINRHQRESNPYYDPSIYIHGVVNQQITGLTDESVDPVHSHAMDPAGPVQPVSLFQRGDAAPMRGGEDALVPAAIKQQFSFWIPELLRESVAMVHSKVIVIDPFGDHPVVMTGSHNMGPKASAKNDDNLVIIENNAALAQAYAVNIISIYQNYQWRLYAGQHAQNEVWSNLDDSDKWQDGHLQGWRGAELEFWLGEDKPAPMARGNAKGGASDNGSVVTSARKSKQPAGQTAKQAGKSGRRGVSTKT